MSAPALFPAADTPSAFDAVRRDESRLRAGVAAICGERGLDPARARRFPDGSLPVYAVGEDSVLKLYPPCFREERDREATALDIVDGRLGIPTPGVVAAGEMEDWGYLHMTRLHGAPLVTAWPQIPDADRLRLARTLGEALARLHGQRDPRAAALHPGLLVRPQEQEPAPGRPDPRHPDPAPSASADGWEAFVADRRAGCRERQAKLGLGAPWLDAVDPFLAGMDLRAPRADALLHTEIMREHLLVAPDPWRLSGLFDFEPAMTGAPEYEFASVGVFFACGDTAVFGAVCDGYGAVPDPRRCLAYALLHRYSNLPWYLERIPPPPGATLDGLAELWWGTAP